MKIYIFVIYWVHTETSRSTGTEVERRIRDNRDAIDAEKVWYRELPHQTTMGLGDRRELLSIGSGLKPRPSTI